MGKNNKNRVLEEIKIPDDIFYQKYSMLNFNEIYPIFLSIIKTKYDLLNKKLEINKVYKKEKLNALSYKLFQEQELEQELSWNKLKKILTIEQSNYFTYRENGIELYLEIENEIAKEEIFSFLNNIENFLSIEVKYLCEYISHIEKLLIYNKYFKENFLKKLFNLILTKNLEISYMIRFFNKKESTTIIYNYIFSNHTENLLYFKNNNRDYIVLVAIFVSNMLEIEEDENQILSVLELSEEEREKVLNEVEFLEDKEIENG